MKVFAPLRSMLAAASMMALVSAASATQYHVIALGVVNDDDTAGQMNSAGIVPGSRYVKHGPLPMLFDHGQVTYLGNSEQFGSAVGVNDSGAVAGNFTHSSTQKMGPFYWKDGTFTRIHPLTVNNHVGWDARAVAINRSGQVLLTETLSGGSPHAFVTFTYDKSAHGAARKVQIPPIPDLEGLAGEAINDAGDVVGDAGGSNNSHAFRYHAGQSVDLGVVPGPTNPFSTARAISASGLVAGGGTDSQGNLNAVLWHADGTRLDLGLVSNLTYTLALGINDSAVVVGDGSDIHGNDFAWVYDGHAMALLDDLLDADSQGWQTRIAWSVDNAGAISGMGTFNGVYLPFLALPVTR